MNRTKPTGRQAFTHKLQTRWGQLQARERTGLQLAVGLLLLSSLWWLWLAPALQVLAQAPSKHRVLDESLASMARMQTQAQALQGRSVIPLAQRRSQLEQSLAALGDGVKLEVQGTQAQVALKAVPAQNLAAWLQALDKVQLQPDGGKLSASPAGGGGNLAGAGGNPSTWSGQVSFTLARQP